VTHVTSTARRGFALPAAVITLVLLSTLIVGVLFVATEELRAGRSDVADQRALTLAERAIDDAIAHWDPLRNTAVDVGTVVTTPAPVARPDDRVDVKITRTQPRSFWIVSRAESQDGRRIPARRAIGASLRLAGPSVPLEAALSAGGAVTVDDGSVVIGHDASAPARHARLCADASPASAAGVLAPDTTRVCGATCGGAPVGVTGSPPVAQAIVAPSDSTVSRFGGEPYATLAARASLVLDGGTIAPGPLVVDGVCDVTNALNWGDPDGATACRDHFPVILVRGSAVLAAGAAGQGILLVDGDLELAPGARFVGVVVASDDIVVRGPDAAIVGVASALDVDGSDGSVVVDGGAIRFASCAARVAALGAARLERTRGRWWSELR
jgi:hypothetical protein